MKTTKGKDDMTRQVELLVSDYLLSNGCIKTFEMLQARTLDDGRKTTSASDDKHNIKSSSSLLDSVVKTHIKSSRRSSSSSTEWSEKDIEALKDALKKVPQDGLEKSERWKQISIVMEKRYSKKECYEKHKELLRQEKRSTRQSKKHEDTEDNTVVALKPSQELTIEDCDDDIDDLGAVSTSGGATTVVVQSDKSTGIRISEKQALSVRQLLFGDSSKCFNTDWMKQGFTFSTFDCLKYGLVQSEGGPCGVLATVQAYFLRYLLYSSTTTTKDWENPTTEESKNALIAAITFVIWQAARTDKCVVALAGKKKSFEKTRGYRNDGLTEFVSLHSASSEDNVRLIVQSNFEQFTQSSGVVLLVYSVIFSRTIDFVSKDMDQPGGLAPTLVGAHSYCTQEMVNLLLTGRASSNVFDNDKILEGSDLTLHGISKRGDVGFLTLFEAYEYMVVGNNYKQPKFPIWVVCSESHYSVLFSKNLELVKNIEACPSEFDLYYYDGLARQDEPIILSVRQNDKNDHREGKKDDDLTPPLNLVINTLFSSATIDWNNTEPIL